MKLLTVSLICGALTLAGCSSSGEDPTTSISPVADDPSLGSISIGTTPGPILQPLPDVKFDGSLDTDSREDGTSSAPVFEDAAVPTDTVDATTGSDAADDSGASVSMPSASESGSIDSSRADSVASGDGATVSTDSVSIPPSDVIDQQQFQAGTLTAGDYDDQLNPHLYQSYASDYLQRVGGKLDIPYLDLSKRIEIHVRDAAGRNSGDATLTFFDGNNELLSLRTPASGKTYIYSDVDVLPENFTIRASGRYGAAIDQTISLSDAQMSGTIDIWMPLDLPPDFGVMEDTVLDVMFVVDTTGSMGDELNYLQTELTPIIDAIPFDKSLINVGLTFYRDIGDAYVVRSHGFTNDIGRAQQTLNDESYDGGGDYPEAMDQALHQAIDANWYPNSRRILFLIADAPPHSNKMRATWNAAEQARLKNIHIVPVAASGVAEDAEYLMRSMAALTNSRYLFLTDDSGYGNPHAEPDVDCYVVTHLDNLMIRVMRSLTTGSRHEPTANDIIRRVGNYDQGVCRSGQ